MLLSLLYNILPLEILVHNIINKYLLDSYCITIVSEKKLDLIVDISFVYIFPNASQKLDDTLLQVSEMGCSDYVILLKEPAKFMVAFEKVNHVGNARRSDRKLIFLPYHDDEDSKKVLLDVLNLKETSFVVNLLLLLPAFDTKDCSSYDLVTHNFVGTLETNQLLHLDSWSSCTGNFLRNNNLFPHDVSNLYGKIIKVACFTYKPYALLDLDTTLAPTGRDGTEVRIVEEFCRWVNCTIEIIRDDENQWGEIYDNQTGIGVLGNVVEDRADLGITALYSWYEEYLVLDFTTSGIRTAITCVAPSPRIVSSWEMPLQPFSWYMWLAVLFTFIFASLALTIAQGCSTNRAFLTTFGMMITQSQYESGSSWRIRSVTGWLLINGLVLDNAYGGGLASVFTVPNYEKPIDTVQDIVDSGIDWGATHDAWVFSLTLSNEPLVKQLLSQFRITPAEVLKRKSYERNMAFAVERLPAGWFAIGDYITKDAMVDLMLMQEDFYFEQCVVMLRKSSPYTRKISQLISRLHESGLMLAWETQVALKYLNYEVQLEVRLSRSKRDVDNIEELGFGHVVGLFIIYMVGVSISVILFILEIVIFRRNNSHRF